MTAVLALGGLAASFIRRIDAATSCDAFDAVTREFYGDFGAGRLSEGEVEALQGRIDLRRGASHRLPHLHAPHVLSRFAPRRHQCSPDKEASHSRRRQLARAGGMPYRMRSRFTESEAAALAIVAGEVKHHGQCDLALDQVAALAGCGRTSVQNAIREAVRLGFVAVAYRPRRGLKNLPNVVRIVSKDWLAWIKRGPAAHKPKATGFKTSAEAKIMNRTKNVDERRGLQESAPRPDRRPDIRRSAQGAASSVILRQSRGTRSAP